MTFSLEKWSSFLSATAHGDVFRVTTSIVLDLCVTRRQVLSSVSNGLSKGFKRSAGIDIAVQISDLLGF